MTSSLLNFFDGDQVPHRVDHAAHHRAVLADHLLADLAQAERAQRVFLVLLAADRGSDLGDAQRAHDQAPDPAAARARARSMAGGATSSSGSPRRAATASGRSSRRSASTVACTMLIELSEPKDLDRMSWMPAHSSTARTAPPAITPVPGLAGRSMTTPAAFSPCTGCGMVPWIRGTLKKDFFASS